MHYQLLALKGFISYRYCQRTKKKSELIKVQQQLKFPEFSVQDWVCKYVLNVVHWFGENSERILHLKQANKIKQNTKNRKSSFFYHSHCISSWKPTFSVTNEK